MPQQNTNHGRDQFIINQPGTVVLPEPKPRPRAEQLLLQAVKDEVANRLRQSLHNAVLIQLGMEPQPNQVNRPWDSDIKIGDRPSVPIPAATSILEIFDQPDIAGKLLILGAPGSGKTTTMLDLAKALCDRAFQQPDDPIPVLLNLSTWKDNNQSMQDWLAAELKSKYGVRKDIGKTWVENRQLLPLLDGLDELEAVRQESCAKAINQILESDARPPDLVVCSRLEEYNTYPTNLQLHGAICLRELDNPQIQAYLTAAQQPQLWHLFQDDPTLLELVRKPLLLSISVLSGQELVAEQWHTLSSTQERLQHLLDAYVRRMMARELRGTVYGNNKPPTTTEVCRWLVYLAQQLKQDFEVEFLIENMQPSCLREKRQMWSFRLIVGIAIGLASCVSFGLIGGVTLGLIAGLLVGLTFADLNGILLIESLQISKFREAKQAVLHELFKLLIVGLMIGFVSGLLVGGLNIVSLSLSLMGGLTLGLILWVLTVPHKLILGLRADVEIKVQPNQGVWKSAENSFLSAGIVSVLFAPTVAGFFWFMCSLEAFYVHSCMFMALYPYALIVSITILVGGGLGCVQHFALRVVLCRSGSIPWNYARFLDYCTDLLLLQRVGGRYRFIHRLLQEYFAAMPLERE